MIEPHTSGTSHTLYELGRIALVFALIGIGTWLVLKLMLRSGKRGLSKKHLQSNRQQRRAEQAAMKRRRRQSAQDRRQRR
ncbi:MAG TPA: hypothetical protein VJU84_03770 [Pyrinomonadaceae bacterium]|nr:hypothetical protein [Pyrinomonadaceae bacterium]